MFEGSELGFPLFGGHGGLQTVVAVAVEGLVLGAGGAAERVRQLVVDLALVDGLVAMGVAAFAADDLPGAS